MPLVLVVQVCQKSKQSKRLKKAVIMHAVGSLPRSEDRERENGSKNETWQKEMQCTWLVVALCQGQRKNKKREHKRKIIFGKK